MDFRNIAALGAFEKIQHFLLNTFAPFKNRLPQKQTLYCYVFVVHAVCGSVVSKHQWA